MQDHDSANRETVRDAVMQAILRVLQDSGRQPPAMDDHTSFRDSIKLDSLDFAVVVVQLEQALGVDPFRAGAQPVQTVGEFVELYAQRGRSQAGLMALDQALAKPVAIVSGGSRGLGLAIVRRLLAGDYAVASFSRSVTPEILQFQQTVPSFYHEVVDAANNHALVSFVAAVRHKFGRLDTLINNAGIAHDTVLALMHDDAIQQMLDINLRAAIILAREAARAMLLQQSGSIVNISSIIAERGFSGLSVYAATKAGMIGMTRSLARELGPRGIRVNAIAPGYLETDMSGTLAENQRQQIIRRTPLGRLGSVEDVVPLVEFLISPGSAFITGQVFTVDGGSSI